MNFDATIGTVSPLYGAKAIPEHFNCQLIFAMKSIPSTQRPANDTGFERPHCTAKIKSGSRLNIQDVCVAHFQKMPKIS
jgi:hypothetical protein